jgi:hypothetical protein
VDGYNITMTRLSVDQLDWIKWRCRTCDKPHHEMFNLDAFAPWHWGDPIDPEPNGALRMDGYFLSEDFCVIAGEHFFVRGVMDIPVEGSAQPFGIGCWSTLSRANFETYVDGFDGEDAEADHPWTGWLSLSMEPFPPAINEPCWVTPRSGRRRPAISMINQEHPLAAAQRDGIGVERLLEIYRVNGHDLG